MTNLFDSLKIGDVELKNRIIMAPLTRMRSVQPGNIPYELNAKYYAQRASAGLIISEATQISNQGQGYPLTPGIHTAAQTQGWKLVVDEVHKNGGKIFAQLWHVGRISHSSFQDDGGAPVAPSAIKPSGKTFTKDFSQVDFETPRALEKSDIKAIASDFINAAKNALDAGFDGVEVHSANGYLLDQFLQDGSNQRTDEYGESIENRGRFLFEVLDEVIKIWGAGRVGVRLSPYGTFNDMKDSDPIALFSYVIKELDKRKIGYLHLIEPRATSAGGDDKISQEAPNTSKLFKKYFSGALISAGGYNAQNAKDAVESGEVDGVAFGRWFVSNPDLPAKIKDNKPLTKYDRSTFYGGAEKGYTDYV